MYRIEVLRQVMSKD